MSVSSSESAAKHRSALEKFWYLRQTGVKRTVPGQYFDAETGLHYNYFRDYDPSVGRYIESDPIGLTGGINTYLYVDSNPIRFSDRTGLVCGTGLCVAGGIIVGTGIRVLAGHFARRGGVAIGIGVLAEIIGLDKRRKERDLAETAESCGFSEPDSGDRRKCEFTGFATVERGSDSFEFVLRCRYRCPTKGLRTVTFTENFLPEDPSGRCPTTIDEDFVNWVTLMPSQQDGAKMYCEMSERFRDYVQQFLAVSELSDPVPTLKIGRWEGSKKEQLMLGLFEANRVPSGPGVAIVAIGQMEFVVTQDAVLKKLAGSRVDIENGLIVVMPLSS